MENTPKAYCIVLTASICYALLMFVWFSLPAYLSIIISDIGLTNTEAGILVGTIPLTYIPLSLLSGFAVDRIGPGRMIGVGTFAFGIGQAGRSFAPDFLSLLILTIVMGFGATVITFGLPKLVSSLFSPENTGRPSALYLIAAMTGSASVFAIGRPILGPIIGGWRPLFFFSGMVALLYGLIWLIVAKKIRIDNIAKKENGPLSLEALIIDLRLVFTHRELQIVVIIGTMYLLINHGMQGWLPTFLESRGISATLAGQGTSLYVVAYVVGILSSSEFGDRFGIRRYILIICGIIIFLGIGALVVSESIALGLIGIVGAGIGTGGISPLIRAIPAEFEAIGSRLTGTAIGFIFAVGEIGGFLGPALIGLLYDVSGSYLPGFVVLATGGLIVICAGLMLLHIDSIS